MRILYTMPYVPIPPTFGGAMRTYHLLKIASAHHDVSVLSFGWPNNEQQLREEFGAGIKTVRIIPRPWTRKLRRLAQLYSLGGPHSFFYLLAHTRMMETAVGEILGNNPFDIVQTEFAHMASYDLHTDAVRLLDAHNVEYDNFRRMWINARTPLRRFLYRQEYRKFFAEEAEACRRYDAVLVTSGRDKAILDTDVPEVPKFIVPNGVDESYFHPTDQQPEPHSLVFTGSMSYLPNSDGALYFLDSIFPNILKRIPGARVYIVGSNPPRELQRRASANVVITGFVDDVRPYVYRSSVYIVPLRMGSGTRLKVLEALAMQKPIVTTSVGCEGIALQHGSSALLADSPDAFADSVVELLHDASLRDRLVRRGYELMRSSYAWSVVGGTLMEIYERLASRGRRTPQPETAGTAGDAR